MATHIVKIKMPDIGEGIAEVELVEWHVQPGDSVVEDQVLADVMTDKATVQVPSPVHGKVLALGGKMGEVMAVGSELISLEVQDEDAAAKQPSAPVEQPRPAEAEQPLAPEPPVQNQGEKPLPSPTARKNAQEQGTQPSETGYWRRRKV